MALNEMTHREFSKRGGMAKSEAKISAVLRNLAKAKSVRSERLAANAAKKLRSEYLGDAAAGGMSLQ